VKGEVADKIGQDLFRFQSALQQGGVSLQEYIERYYIRRWTEGPLKYILAIRTSFVNSIFEFLQSEGLVNIEKLQISPLTDPLAHDVEHVPSIEYKGHSYLLTHSMIYAKFLACVNPSIMGIFVDSPNIRLEIESPDHTQRGKYLIDFSQIDLEIRRNRGIDFDKYLHAHEYVRDLLVRDMEKAIDFFERLIVHAVSRLCERHERDFAELGVAIRIPRRPFPRFRRDEAFAEYGRDFEVAVGQTVEDQFYWITGLVRENYDLVYPYLLPGGKVSNEEITSDTVFNYDICAKSFPLDDKQRPTPGLEILSGGLREWLFETIVERLLDNRIIPSRPVFKNGSIENIQELGGYGPFLLMASRKNKDGTNFFPETFGGGIGVERTLFAICRGPAVQKIEDITFFGKNPDSHPLYLF